jgi:hypothetical protein
MIPLKLSTAFVGHLIAPGCAGVKYARVGIIPSALLDPATALDKETTS